MLRPRQIAERLGVPYERVRVLIHEGCLPAVDLSPNPKRPTYWVKEQDLDQFLAARKVGAPAAAARQARARASRAPSQEAIDFMRLSMKRRQAG